MARAPKRARPIPLARARVAARSRDEPAAFGRYVVEELVGEGSMGRVYRGFDPLAHRPVAIKTVRPEYRSGPEAEEYLSRFRREAQAAAGLSHPNIVTVFDVGEDYFVMELLEGTTLEAVLRGHARLSPSAVLDILGPIAEAMDLAHRKGIVHRDIKPANIFLLTDGRPKIMDFGVAHLRAAAMTAAGTLWGSPSYMAPEQVTNSRASASTDVFSLGIVAYQMLTGRKPFEGENISAVLYRVVHAEPAAVSAQAPDLPTRYDEVFRRALAKDPAGRFPTATAFVTALGGADPGAPDLARPLASSAAGSGTATPSMEDVETHELKRAPQRARDWPARSLASWVRQLRSRRPVAAIGLVALAGLILAFVTGARLPWSSGGSVEITTEPPHATVRIDGVVAGATPMTRRGLRAGAHTLQLTLAGYAPTEMTLEVDDDSVPTPLRFALQPTAASLHVGSAPPGATVRVDGASVGVTPLSGFPASPGTHDVAVEARGYRTWRQKVHLGAGTEVSLSPKLVAIAGASSSRLEALGWVRPGDIVALGPGVTPPRRISGEPAPYPAAAKKQRIGGTVVVEFTVTERGEPDDIRVVRSGGAILDAGMTAAVRTWRYAPAERNGVKVRVRIRADQQFRFKK